MIPEAEEPRPNDLPLTIPEKMEPEIVPGAGKVEERLQGLAETLFRLEKVVRSEGRDNLALVRGQKDTQTALQTILARLDEFELTNKGLAQTVWRTAQDSQSHMQNAEQHFAGAIRELEARMREEMQWQIYRSALQAIFPALDDMDLVIINQRDLNRQAGREDALLEAMVLIRQKLADGLRTLGLEEITIIEGVTRFDPSVHQSVEADTPALPQDEEVPPGTIIRVRRVGYRLNGQIFRVPQVLVQS